MSRPDRERQAIAQVACPDCGVKAGTGCRLSESARAQARRQGRPIIHSARREAWRAQRPSDPVESADIVHTHQFDGETNWLILAPLTERGRQAMPRGIEKLRQRDVRARLRELRDRGLIVMREQS